MSGEETGGEEPAGSGLKRFPRSYFEPKPVKIGDEIDVEISEVSRKGDGVARVQGYVIFIPNAKQGEKKRIKVSQVRPNYAMGEILEDAAPKTQPE
ncbi:MAG TPA: TRAM domain-containing protein [Nitrososphaerales archaeon]|nr:TRAM domain-containing protein [Nitrososphaerales archaeon]